MESSTIDSMCRCCAAEGIFKDIKTSYHWMGEEEVYGDMLQECFDVKLATIEEGGICEVCITQLRNAANFKKQVLHTERKFKRHLESRRFKPTEVKEELSGDNGNSSDDNDRGADDTEEDEDYVPEFEIPIKTESTEETKSRKRTAKASSSRAKKSRIAVEEKSSSPEPQTVPTTSAAASADPISELSPRQSKIRDIKQVLLCSNATPIWSHNSRANMCYKCSYCELKYARLDRLKKHTLDEHDDITEARFFRGKHDLFHEIYVKLDITALNCKLCCGNFDDINTLIEHLNQIHKKRVDVKVTNFLLPFKFFSETLYCGICSKKDSTFKSLEQHLNVHMKIYKCKKCDEVFTTYRMLQIHDDAEHKHNPPKKIVKRRSSNLPFLCRECGEKFPSEYRQRVHVAKVHKEPNNYHCKACDRVYDRADELRVHTRRDHLMERRFKCKVCDKAFYAQATMLKHELSHSNEKKYSCDVCGKAFKCKTSLFPHMQIHADDRRFKCEVCERAFVQKASWQGHMRSKHDVIV